MSEVKILRRFIIQPNGDTADVYGDYEFYRARVQDRKTREVLYLKRFDTAADAFSKLYSWINETYGPDWYQDER